MKRLIMIALLALAACDDQPKSECVLKHHTIGSLFRAAQAKDGTTPQQIAASAIEQYRVCGGK